MRSFHIDLINAFYSYFIHTQKVGFPGAKFQCKRNMDGMYGRSGGALCKNRIVREYKPPSREQLEGEKEEEEEEEGGGGLHACKFYFAPVIIIMIV